MSSFSWCQTTRASEFWSQGSITLNDGTVLNGLLNYVSTDGVVVYRTGAEDPEIRTIFLATIVKMNFNDLAEGINRKFYSLAFPNAVTGNEEVFLYEVLKEFDTFVLLSKKDQLQTQVSSYQNSYSISPKWFSSKSTVTQTEEFYFVDKEKGQLEKYLTLSYKRVRAGMYGYRNEEIKFLDKTLFPKYLKQSWEQVQKYEAENHIKLDRRENILLALNYYEALGKKNNE